MKNIKTTFKGYLLTTEKYNRYVSTDSKKMLDILKQEPYVIRIDRPTGYYLHNIDLRIEDGYIDILENFLLKHNWYISRNRNNNIEISKKYVSEAEKETPKILYHITPTKNIKSILENGIIPKSEDMRHKYPNRVYVADNISSLKQLAKELKRWKGPEDYSIIQINTKELDFKLYKDTTSAYIGNYYIQDIDKIPPTNIKIIENNI